MAISYLSALDIDSGITTASSSTLAGATFTSNLILDDGSGDSPYVRFTNGDNDYWQLYNNSSGKLIFSQNGTTRGTFSSGDLELANALKITTISEIGSDTDAFLMSDSGTVKYVTGANLRSYIGAGTGSGSVTSVGFTHAGNAFTVGGSPVTSAGTLAVTMAGTSSQYIDGAGTLTTFPSTDNYNYWIASDSTVTQNITSGATLTFEGGTGITTTKGSGKITFANSGVTSIVAGTNVTISGATGAVTINSTDQYSGNVSNTGTPLNNQLAIWTNATTIEGDSDLTFDGSNLTTTGTVTWSGGSSAESNSAYDNMITGFSDSGTSTITLTLTQQDAGTLTTSFSVPQGTMSSWDVQTDSGAGAAASVTNGDTVTFTSGNSTLDVTNSGLSASFNLANTAVTAGSYTSTALTVDAQGRITAASSGSPGDISGVTAGSGLTGGGTSGTVTLNVGAGKLITVDTDVVNVDLTLLNDMTDPWVTGSDEFVVLDGGTAQKRKLSSEIFGSNAFNSSTIYAEPGIFSGGGTPTLASGVTAAEIRSLIGAGTSSTSGTVTSVATGTGLSGGTITSTGTITLANTAVTAGSYTSTALTVDAQGRITAASSGSPGDITAVEASTSNPGKGIKVSSGTGPVPVVGLDIIDQTNLAATAAVDDELIIYDLSTTTNKSITVANLIAAAPQGDITAVVAGTGLSGGGTSGSVTLNNTGVTSNIASTGISVSGATGAVTITNTAPNIVQTTITGNSGSTTKLVTARTIASVSFNGTANISLNNNAITNGAGYTTNTGTVTSVATGTGLSGGTITGTGTITLANTAVSAGSYTHASITVDAQGRLTSASSGSDAQGVTSVATGAGLSGGTITATGTLILDVESSTTTTTSSNADWFSIANTAGTTYKIAPGDIDLSTMNNDSGWTTNSGTVTSVAATASTGISISGSPITTSGTLTITNTAPNIVQTTITGNAGTATALQTARNIAGVSFDGTANISLNNNAITNGAGYTTNTGTTTASNTQTFTNKSGNISQWTNDSGYTTNVGDITGVTAGTGLSGGGTSGTVTLNLANTAVSAGSYTATALTVDAQGRITAASSGSPGDITGVTAGALLDGGGTSGTVTLDVDLSEATDMTAAMVGTDEFIVLDSSAQRRKAANEIGLSIFSNDSGFTTNAGTVTSSGITAGAGISVSGSPITSSGNITVTNTITNNNQLTNGAGYTTNTGTTTASNTQTFTNKSGNISQWTNDSGYTTYAEPGIFSGGGTPTLASGVTGAEVRTLIGAGTGSGSGSVTSVTLAASTGITLSGTNPITSSGTITITNSAPNIVQTTITGNAGTATALQTARTIAGVSFDGTANISLNNNAITNGAGYTTNTGDITSVTAREGLTGGGTSGGVTLDVDYAGTDNVILSATDDAGNAVVTGDYIITSNKATNAVEYHTVSDLPFSNNDGDITGVTAGTGMSGGGTTGTVTLNNAGVTSNVASTGISVSGATGAVTITNTSPNIVQTTITGNAGSATLLQTARTISGTSFNGGANITLNNSSITNGAGYTTNTGTTTASNTQTFTNKSGNNSQWTNDSGYVTSSGGSMSSWDLTAEGGAATAITNGETVDFNGGTNITTSRSGATITINNGITNNTQLTNGAGYTTNTGTTTASNSQTFTNKGGNISQWTNNSGYITSYVNTTYTAGTALDLSGTTFNVDLSELSTSTTNGDGDYFVVTDTSNAQRKLTKANISLSGMSNDSGWTTNSGTVTSVAASAGTGITISGSPVTSSGTLTITNSAPNIVQTTITGNAGSATKLETARNIAGVSFNGTANISLNNNAITNGAGYTTNAGDITGVTAGTGMSGGGTSGTVTLTNAGVTSIVAGTGIDVSGATGAVTVSTEQDIDTGADVQFDSFGVGTAASGTTGMIRATNNIYAYYSDERLKDFEGNIPNALDKVCQLGGYYFRENDLAKSLGYDNQERQVGVNAQEVEKIMPEVVHIAPISDTGAAKGVEYKTVSYDKLVPLLIESIKELKAEIDELKKS